MLNYIWATLILLGVFAALTTDLFNESSDKFRNNIPLDVILTFENGADSITQGNQPAVIHLSAHQFNKFYRDDISSDINADAVINYKNDVNSHFISVKTNEQSPKIWKEMSSSSVEKNELTGSIKLYEKLNKNTYRAEIIFDPISFIKLKDVTNAVIDYAGTAVTIALGLIGIMALWLGIMKIAEDAGLIKIIAKLVKPFTKRLFPDIPSDHPAISSIIMNISANMLGLGNAATPFGLKAMEEMNKINPDKGTASNSMVTFLAINTAGLTLIPATVIAVRAASGSSNPAIIIGTSIFGAFCATVAGLICSKISGKILSGFLEVFNVV